MSSSEGEASETPQQTDPGGPETRTCEHCGSEFEPYRDWQRFCPGGSCRKAAWREAHEEEERREVARRVLEQVKAEVLESVEEAFENLKL